MKSLTALVVLQVCFMLVNCRKGIISYDTPQQAIRDETTETEMRDETSQDILVTGTNVRFVRSIAILKNNKIFH